MTTAGRPTAYRPEFCELAHNYCLLGATNPELAGFFDVAPRTIDNWIASHPAFTGPYDAAPTIERINPIASRPATAIECEPPGSKSC